jgi:hypothetical protein
MKYRLPDGRTELRAHDVRHLAICHTCGEIGDNRVMIQADLFERDGPWHDECFVKAYGPDAVLALPEKEQAKFTLKSTGVALMKKLLR